MMRTIIRIEVSKTKANVAVATNLVVVKELTLSLDALGFNELTYFAHPYTSSERGTNEVHNRMIQQFVRLVSVKRSRCCVWLRKC